MKADWVWRTFMGLIGTITMLLVVIIGWFIREAYATQQTFNAQIGQRVTALELRGADISITTLDKRVSINESNIANMVTRIEKIDAKIDRVLDNQARAARREDHP